MGRIGAYDRVMRKLPLTAIYGTWFRGKEIPVRQKKDIMVSKPSVHLVRFGGMKKGSYMPCMYPFKELM